MKWQTSLLGSDKCKSCKKIPHHNLISQRTDFKRSQSALWTCVQQVASDSNRCLWREWSKQRLWILLLHSSGT